MATITQTYPDTSNYPNTKQVQWAFTAGDTGVAEQMNNWADKTVIMTGTFNGATVIVEQSVDNVTFVQSQDPEGNAISMTANAIKTILDNAPYIRPRVSSGSVTAVTITIMGARNL
jgi:hypothetical protein